MGVGRSVHEVPSWVSGRSITMSAVAANKSKHREHSTGEIERECVRSGGYLALPTIRNCFFVEGTGGGI